MSSRPSRGAARLAAILDALPDGLVLVNCNGTVVNANTIALGMFETPGTALVGRGLLDLLPGFDSRLIPGSMRLPEGTDEQGRTKPTRMIARRTDGSEFAVEVTSASLEDGREAYDSYSGYTGDELLMLVVRDLTGTLDTEAELARSQRQTEMILRAAAEGVVGTDTDGRVVLVNPAAAQILGFRASDLGGKELHPLILHSRPDGEPFPYEESPLADTLKSGRKHRVRNQVLWAKNGSRVPVDLTTAPVRDGDQLVGAVMTFTDRRPYEQLVEKSTAEVTGLTERHAAELERLKERHEAELAQEKERYEAELAGRKERYEALAARHEQLTAVLGESLRGPLEELRTELSTLAADDAGQLWPEANQLLHHLAAGYARMTTLVDNVLGYQRLDAGAEALDKGVVLLDSAVSAGVDGAVELIGPGRAQFAVHAPPIEAEVDAGRLATALAHLVADVAGVDSTGKARVVPGAGYADSTIVVAAAQRGDVVRIEVRGPYAGGDPVHQPIVRGIVAAHGGVVQTHEVPGTGGSAYVLEVPIGAGRGTVASSPAGPARPELQAAPGVRAGREAQADQGSGAVQAGQGTDAGQGSGAVHTDQGPGAVQPGQGSGAGQTAGAEQGPAAGQLALPAQASETQGGGRRRARRASTDAFLDSPVAPGDGPGPTGRRRGRTESAQAPATPHAGTPAELIPSQNSGTAPDAVPNSAVVAADPAGPTGRRRGRPAEGSVVTAAESAQGRAALGETVPPQGVPVEASAPALARALPAVASPEEGGAAAQPTGRRRRALAAAQERAAAAEAGPRTPFALPPADADPDTDTQPEPAAPAHQHQQPVPVTGAAQGPSVPSAPLPVSDEGRHEAVPSLPDTGLTPEHSHPQPYAQTQPVGEPTGRRRAADVPDASAVTSSAPGGPGLAQEAGTSTGSVPLPPAQPLPAEAPVPREQTPGEQVPKDRTQGGRAFSVRTLGQGVPFAQQIAAQQSAQQSAAQQSAPSQTTTTGTGTSPGTTPGAGTYVPHGTNGSNGSGRRRKLATPPEGDRPSAAAAAAPAAADPAARPHPQPAAPAHKLAPPAPEGRAYAIGAPAEGSAEGPEPLDGPGGAVEVANRPLPQPVDDELPPEPLDNPRRLLVWPAPDVATQQALSDRGYRPVIVHSREEVDAQIAAFPAALFVDPLTGPITRTALQSLRRAAVAAEVPVLLAAGLGQATREAAYGADPAVLLKALAPRDSEQHPSRVLLIEEHEEIATALAATLERRGMQVARAATDTEAVTLATQTRPNLVVMDLMQVRRRRAGIIDWLRANGQLNHTPLVVYTSAGLDEAELPRLASGETVLFLAERSTSDEVQARIVDLLAKIGTN
ncbi:PAS domain-containing protein [Streptomyces sp. NPDC053755]|uniref:PAS domain-containing protein n=1 Tax=Streptomyces sp. NPDC053755 TaxID=3155815 RepID=UPI00342E9CEB